MTYLLTLIAVVTALTHRYSDDPPHRHCNDCGENLPTDASFCTNCGSNKLSDVDHG